MGPLHICSIFKTKRKICVDFNNKKMWLWVILFFGIISATSVQGLELGKWKKCNFVPHCR